MEQKKMILNKKISIVIIISLLVLVILLGLEVLNINNKMIKYEVSLKNYKEQDKKIQLLKDYAKNVINIYPGIGGSLLDITNKLEKFDFKNVESNYKDLPITYNDILTYDRKDLHNLSKYIFSLAYFKSPIRDPNNIEKPDPNSFVTCEYGKGVITVWDKETEQIIKIFRKHTGIDIVNTGNKIIFTMAKGKVIETGWEPSYGRYIRILHKVGDDYYITDYAHLSVILVKEGDILTDNSIIGRMGSSGSMCFGEHLHVSTQIVDNIYYVGSKVIYCDHTINPVATSTYSASVSSDCYYDNEFKF
jgi:hypothetical protein